MKGRVAAPERTDLTTLAKAVHWWDGLLTLGGDLPGPWELASVDHRARCVFLAAAIAMKVAERPILPELAADIAHWDATPGELAEWTDLPDTDRAHSLTMAAALAAHLDVTLPTGQPATDGPHVLTVP